VVVDYNYNFGFSGHNGGMDGGEAIYFNRIGLKKSATYGKAVFEITTEPY
jgi:hypothetical protein